MGDLVGTSTQFVVEHLSELAIAAAVIVVPSAAMLLVLSVTRALRRLNPPPETLPWWEMQPGYRYHVEIWPAHRAPYDFVDEFLKFSGYTAVFRTRTVRREITDRVHVAVSRKAQRPPT